MSKLELPKFGVRRRRILLNGAAVAVVFVGILGGYRYAWTDWTYRGFAAPTTLTNVVVAIDSGFHGVRVVPTSVVHFTIPSPALGGFADPVYVVLPPGYAQHPNTYYPTFYLLHGQPGEPQNFLNIGNVQGVEAKLVAEKRMKPMILVMPTGSPGFLIDTEWANGIHSGSEWMTFVAQDLVATIDRRFRAIPNGNARAIGGYSEGAYAALNIDFHHVGEFGVIESWSGYMVPLWQLTSVFGTKPVTLDANSPYDEARLIAPDLIATHSYIWMYTGSKDRSAYRETIRFTRMLEGLHVPFVYAKSSGSHDWSLWRSMVGTSLIVASEHLGNETLRSPRPA